MSDFSNAKDGESPPNRQKTVNFRKILFYEIFIDKIIAVSISIHFIS
jgi:hypothetical protein